MGPRAPTRHHPAWAREHLPDIIPLEDGPHHRWIASRLHPDHATGVRAFAGAPRGSGKTTVANVLVPIIAAVRRSHRFVLLIRAAGDDATKAVEAIKAAIESRPDLVARYPWLRIRRYADGELRLAGMLIVGRGAGAAIRGLQRQLGNAIVRPDLVVVDDLETEETARSKLLTNRLAEWLLATVGQLGGPPGDAGTKPLDIIGIGTTLAPDAVANRILRGRDQFASWDAAAFPAEARVELDTRGMLIAKSAAGVVPIPIPPGAQPGDRIAMWPAGMPLTYLDELQNKASELFIGSRLYAQEYLLAPQAREDTIFKAEHTVYIVVDTPRLERTAIGVDPAASKRDAADYTALVATGIWLPDGAGRPPAIAVPYAGRRRQTLHELLGWAAAVWEELRNANPANPPVVVFEANGAFVWGAQELRRVHRIPVRPVTADADKLTRAQPASVWHEAGRVHLAEHLRNGEFPDELHAFTGTNADAHDDQVDAFVWAATYSTSAWRKR